MTTLKIKLTEDMAFIPVRELDPILDMYGVEKTRIVYRICSMLKYAQILGEASCYQVSVDGRVHFRGNDHEDLITIDVNNTIRFKVVDEASKKILAKQFVKSTDGYYSMILWQFIAYTLSAGIKVENDEVEFDADSQTIHFTKELIRR